VHVLAALLVLLIPIVLVAAEVGLTYWVLAPLEWTARWRAAPTQFTTLDFFALVFLLQLPLMLMLSLDADRTSMAFWVGCTYGWILLGLCWWYGVMRLSRAAVRKGWHRAIVLALVVPLGILAPATFVLLLAVGLVALINNSLADWIANWHLVAAGLALLAAMAVGRRLLQHVVRAAETVETVPRVAAGDEPA